ncbi:AAA family ATPase [Salinisphaera sp. SPP-AMP-43]|uniref:AAA family ATPase n=1 Tax=Salinisphaera sp. SPP-AMP-43 TaxID=3121288 RepID=UPI003C6E6AFA
MIRTLTLADVATYPIGGMQIGPLTKCNFVYGPNGSGKTTLSRYLADQQGEAFEACSVVWGGGRALRTDVYNRDFLQDAFSEDGKTKGVFTLGEEDKEAKERISQLTDDIAEEADKELRLTVTLQGDDGNGGKQAEMAAATEELKDACLAQTRKHKEEFGAALKGVMGNSEVFRARLLREREQNDGDTCLFEDLQTRAHSVFTANPVSVSRLELTDLVRLKALEEDPIFRKAIIGKADVNIAGLIAKLNNSDWVSQGVKFLKESRPKCPFCQQSVPDSLEQDLADFFDESFTRDTARLKQIADDYKEEANRISTALENLRATSTDYHDSKELGRLIDVFDARLSSTLLQIRQKIQSPSSVIELDDVVSALEDINKLLMNANARIAEHNQRVANAASEKARLSADFWRYLIDVELKDDLDRWDKSNNSIGRAISSLKEQIQASKDKQDECKTELNRLEERATSTKPTVEKINQTLNAFQFTNFRLEPAEEAHSYHLVRSNGESAYHSLSEGEKTFISFLYFYHLSQAANSATGIEDDRVVVLDDPVSSLDSDILFIVSSLTREMADMARSGDSPIKQVFVLTHNVYFHKEVTFAKGGGLPKSAFWVCRKTNGVTGLVAFQNTNPVKSSYELLWQDVRKPEGRSLTLPNTMRRIFDSYFKLLGGLDVDKACDGLVGDEKIAARALLSWANDGSHAVHDDLHMVPNGDADALYLKVFRRIFENLHQGDHYRMMMDTDFKPE